MTKDTSPVTRLDVEYHTCTMLINRARELEEHAEKTGVEFRGVCFTLGETFSWRGGTWYVTSFMTTTNEPILRSTVHPTDGCQHHVYDRVTNMVESGELMQTSGDGGFVIEFTEHSEARDAW